MGAKNIYIKGAREHNLKNIDLSLPRDQMIVFTGLSGSGKSSLAFDTIFAEGQRRYMESLSSYARQFLGQMEKPDVDYIEGLSPAVSIDQKTTSKNPRSTVGTVTEIYDYLRLLYARIGIAHCPKCGKEIKRQTIDQIADKISSLPEGSRIYILSPVVRGQKGEHKKVFEDAKKSGFVRVRVDGNDYELTEKISLDKNKKHTISIIVDRLIVKGDLNRRIFDSAETASSLSGGLVTVSILDGEEYTFSENYACDDCGVSMDELSPRMFSFNNPFGACPSCGGLGDILRVDPDLIIPDDSKSIREGAIHASGWSYFDGTTVAAMYYTALGEKYGFTMDTKLKDFSPEARHALLYGTNGEKLTMNYLRGDNSGTYVNEFEGIVNNLERRFRETNSDFMRSEIALSMGSIPCDSCKGARLNKMSLGVTVGKKNINELCRMPITGILRFLDSLELTDKEQKIAVRILKEIKARLSFLENVGLEYLTLSRNAGTLSGGESQRIRLATQIGSSLTGVLYILDEPSIGLHQRDNEKLLNALKELRDLGNTLIVVEHDEDTMRAADYLVDIGPGAGVNGGEVVAAGSLKDIENAKNSLTGDYLSGRKKILVPEKRRQGNGKFLEIRGASENNLKNINVKIPIGVFTAVTGVSGSGKSSLVNEILYKELASKLNGAKLRAGKHKEILGLSEVDKVIDIDQSPIGRTPRSNPATYTGMFTDIRDIFASTKEAKALGYKSGRFSFNVKGGRCEACQGDGTLKIEMHFLPDIYVDCEVCKGKRYNRETLEIRYKGKNIYEVLEMTVDEALIFFENLPKIRRKLETLKSVGLGYVKLGQSSTTLSGGEAQRVKLATELSKRSTGRTVYILDEPTTGLHTYDVHNLIEVLQYLVDAGNTVVVIEHNLDVIKTADYLVDLGPEGGDKGGEIVCTGTPEEVAKVKKSYTGQFLEKWLLK